MTGRASVDRVRIAEALLPYTAAHGSMMGKREKLLDSERMAQAYRMADAVLRALDAEGEPRLGADRE